MSDAKKKVLIVEDEEDLCEIITEFLTEYAWDVTSTQTLEEAQKLLVEQTWSVLLIDFHLAFNTTATLLDFNARNQRYPVILMTGAPTLETAQIARDLYKHLIVKPFTIRELLALLPSSDA